MTTQGRHRRIFLNMYYILLVIAGIYIMKLGKEASFLNLSSIHTPFLDFLMKYLSHLGSGLFAAILGILLLFRKIRYGIYLLLTTLSAGLVVQSLKNFVFSDHMRPLKYFNELGISIYQVPGVDVHSYHSFPSGHSATAFALCFSLIFITGNRTVSFVFFIFAWIIGYTRVYLAQHFPIDVLGGSLIGMIAAIAFYPLVFSWKASWLETDLIRIIKKK